MFSIFVNNVILNNDKIEINIKSPIKKNYDENQGSLIFKEKVQEGFNIANDIKYKINESKKTGKGKVYIVKFNMN